MLTESVTSIDYYEASFISNLICLHKAGEQLCQPPGHPPTQLEQAQQRVAPLPTALLVQPASAHRRRRRRHTLRHLLDTVLLHLLDMAPPHLQHMALLYILDMVLCLPLHVFAGWGEVFNSFSLFQMGPGH